LHRVRGRRGGKPEGKKEKKGEQKLLRVGFLTLPYHFSTTSSGNSDRREKGRKRESAHDR